MRVATWNLARCRAASVRAARLRDWMARIDADVWVLTETYCDLSPEPAYTLIAHSASAPDRDSRDGEVWVAIWSRLTAEPIDLTADQERVAAVRIVSSDVIVVGTVLPWLADCRHAELRGADAFVDRLAAQSAEWRRLRDEGPGGLCVAGDFNQDLLTPGHYYGSRQGRSALRNTLAACGLDCLTADADDPLAARDGRASIDHITVAGLKARGEPRSHVWPPAGELNPSLSDHYGVWSDLVAD
ncbi:MAG: endonuclease/exonuclease/phosphatase family protein [Planctomycetaceae bacterium]|nr:endonuclease/exonuclease/phosphatase family protein [Planctomycetaceae bacterium]